MEKEEKKPNLLDLMREMMDDHLGKEEFVKQWEGIINHVKAIEEKLHLLSGQKAEELDGRFLELSKMHGQNLDTLQNDVQLRVQSIVSDLLSRAEQRLSELKDGAPGLDGKDADEEAISARLKAELIAPITESVTKNLPTSGTAVRDALELLQDEERLDASAIKGLEKLIKKHAVGDTVYLGGGSGGSSGGGRIVKVYDLSASLNGVTKTFALPAFWRVLTVDVSSSPHVLRPTVDFTTDASAMTITFTSQINAGSTLATGQTCLVTYSE